MREASFAEWIFRRATSRERASSIVGDLIELGDQKGRFWFWFSTARVLLSLTWRRPLAFVAAFYVGNWLYGKLLITIYGFQTQHQLPLIWGTVFNFLEPAIALLWTAAVYLTIRFGLHGQPAQFALAAAGTLTAAICCWWQPTALVACSVASIFMLWLSIKDQRRRRAAVSLPFALAAAWFVVSLSAILLYVVVFKIQRLIYPGILGARDPHAFRFLSCTTFCAEVMETWIVALACSISHQWTIRLRKADQDIDWNPTVE
jgi:hypothetical protein